MRNPIHKRLENLESWQHLTFMAALCERMAPNFKLFCQMNELNVEAKTYQNILNLVWEYLTVKDAKINFENQLEKLETIIPDVNDYESFGVVPALDACQALAEILHAIIAGETLERAVEMSLISLGTVTSLLETETGRDWSESELKENEDILCTVKNKISTYLFPSKKISPCVSSFKRKSQRTSLSFSWIFL